MEDLIIRDFERKAYQSVAKVVTVDRRIKDYINHLAHIEAETIKNFIDVAAFKPETTDRNETRQVFQIPLHKKMLFVPRRMTEKNGVIYPIMALPEVLKNHHDTVLVYAGTGEQQAHIIGELNLERKDILSEIGTPKMIIGTIKEIIVTFLNPSRDRTAMM